MTMKSSINVLIYSYKGRSLKDNVLTLSKNLSGKHEVGIGIIDQHPLDRRDFFEKELGFGYRHIFWDFITNPNSYFYSNTKNSTADYFLLLSDNIVLPKNWDDELIKSYTKSTVLSGQGGTKLKAKNLFYLDKEIIDTNKITKTNFINRDFIFASREVMISINFPDYIKYNGVEEILSIDLFTKGVDIYSMPSNFYSYSGPRTIETLYVPFSINHNYNEAIDLLQTGKNKFHSIINRNKTVKDFADYHNFDFNLLNKLPFPTNDVDYDPEKLNFNKVDARRYVATTKAIH